MRTATKKITRLNPVGLYIHFPWCIKKCPYCDFNSHPVKNDFPEQEYKLALRRDLEIAFELSGLNILTIFCGGGTPSLFSPDTFFELIEQCRPWLESDAEITMEVNPGAIEHGKLSAYRQAGINRISIGAQTFDPNQLKAIGRIHSPEEIIKSCTEARKAGFTNINIDLMYGLPQQKVDQAITDLEKAMEISPEHISWYQLTIEPKTEFARRPPILSKESDIAEIEDLGHQLLRNEQFTRYEVSAYAKDGYECRHNLNYWKFGNYLGVGAGAHGKLSSPAGDLRTQKPSQPRLYLSDPLETKINPIDRKELVGEFMMNVLRLAKGVEFEHFTYATKLSIDDIKPLWDDLANEGLVEPNRIATTAHGYRHLDTIIQRFL